MTTDTAVAEVIEPAPPAPPAPPADRAAGLVAYAKDVIAGRVVPPMMVPTPRAAAWLDAALAEAAGPNPPPTPEARQRTMDWQCLYEQYPDRPVMRFTTAGGWMAVLAYGGDDICLVLDQLTAEETARIVIEYPNRV